MRIALSCCRAGVQKPTQFATVVTDLTTCHNTWFHPRVDQCFVATQEARRRAMRMGLKVGLQIVLGAVISVQAIWVDLRVGCRPLASHSQPQAFQCANAVRTSVRRPRDPGSKQEATPHAPWCLPSPCMLADACLSSI